MTEPAPAAAAAPSFSRLVTLRCQGPPPPPAPKLEAPTPDEEFERHLAEQQQRSQQVHEEQKRAAESAKETKSMFGKLSAVTKSALTTAGDALNKAHDSAEVTARGQLHRRNVGLFQENFPELATSKYLCAYGCKAMHAGQKIEGTLFVSSTAVAFVSKVGVKETIPFSELASVVPSVALPTSKVKDGKESGPPFILPLPHPSVQGDCLQLFTTDGKIIQFLQFDNTIVGVAQAVTTSVKGNAYDRSYNWIDHAWREAVQVPLNIPYASSAQ